MLTNMEAEMSKPIGRPNLPKKSKGLPQHLAPTASISYNPKMNKQEFFTKLYLYLFLFFAVLTIFAEVLILSTGNFHDIAYKERKTFRTSIFLIGLIFISLIGLASRAFYTIVLINQDDQKADLGKLNDHVIPRIVFSEGTPAVVTSLILFVVSLLMLIPRYDDFIKIFTKIIEMFDY
jgi:hypothetical protein